MRLINFRHSGRTEFGVEHQGFAFPLRAAGYASDLEFFVAGDSARLAAGRFLAQPGAERIPLRDVQLLSPVLKPGKILCIGLNYRDHAIESKMEIPKVPTVFLKLPSAVIGPEADIVLPRNVTQPDYEAEFAAVLGAPGRNIATADWQKHIAGYTILNDVSARDVQLATSQWTLGKSFDTFCPIGPAVVTPDEIPDPHALDIRLTLNGELMQHSNTRELIFKLPDLIAHLSSIVPLEPGDIISTGTPAGVGLGRTPQRWLRPGEQIEITIEGIGTLRNRTIAA